VAKCCIYGSARSQDVDIPSTITHVKKGGDVLHSKYMRVRQESVKERREMGDVVVEYTPTGDMIADILSMIICLYQRVRCKGSFMKCCLTGNNTHSLCIFSYATYTVHAHCRAQTHLSHPCSSSCTEYGCGIVVLHPSLQFNLTYPVCGDV